MKRLSNIPNTPPFNLIRLFLLISNLSLLTANAACPPSPPRAVTVSQTPTKDWNGSHQSAADAGNRHNWYVRPARDQYGKGDGTTYNNAWNSLLDVVWGQGGVAPGDTLWVCGLHVHHMENTKYIATQASIDVISGSSEISRVTIRGDCPNDQGIVWGAFRFDYSPWNHHGGGVWSIPLPANMYQDWFFQDIGTPNPSSFINLARQPNIDALRQSPGSFFLPDPQRGKLLYVHLKDKGNPQRRIFGNRYGYKFNLDKAKYITFKNLHLSNFRRIEPQEVFSHVAWDGVKFSFGEHSLLGFRDGIHHIQINNSELSWSGNGIYHLSTTNYAPNNFIYKGNHIHDIGIRAIHQNSDAHGIGIQGGHSGLIEDNLIERAGTGVTLYSFKYQDLKDVTIRKNTIRNTHLLGGANSRGVEFSMDNDAVADKRGIEIYENHLNHTNTAIRLNGEYEQKVYDNVICHSDIGLSSNRNFNGVGPNISFINNTLYSIKEYNISVSSGAHDFTLYSNNNHYRSGSGKFFFKNRVLNFREWQALDFPRSTFDSDSISIR